MSNDLLEELRQTLEVTRELCAMTLELAKQGRQAIIATRAKIESSRLLLKGGGNNTPATGLDPYQSSSFRQSPASGEPARFVRDDRRSS
jgi:hypothetical protein